MKRLFSALLALCLLFSLSAARAERSEIPKALQFTQETTARDYVREQQYVQKTYPKTSNQQVNKEIKALVDEMTDRGRPALPKGKIEVAPSYLDVGATISRTGTQWMSFLTIARIDYEREQTYVDFDARVYDMVTGEQLKLTALFDESSGAWALLQDAVREQLTAYFMYETPDAAVLEALCAREAVENAAFTLTPAKLQLHYRADQLYPGKNTLMHVTLYYSQLRPLMNETGQAVTDNSMYKMVALTYDDGGSLGATTNVLNQLRAFGANATFFIVGTMMGKNHHVMSRQHDAGYAMASHNWEHVYENLTKDNIFAWKEKFDRTMDSIVGIRPSYMRAPGGHYQAFINAGAGYPMIQWDVISGDAGNDNVAGIATTVKNNIHDGAVVLMHDINPKAYAYTESILEFLTQRNYLCVTVDELFDHYGVELLPDQVYVSCREEAAAQP